MAEILVGDITARLRIDASGFDQALTQAQQRLAQLSQTMGQVRQQQSGSQQATQQYAQALQQLTQAVQQQAQAVQQQSQASSQAGQATRQQAQALQQLTQAVQQQAQAVRQQAQAFQQQAQAFTQAQQATQQLTQRQAQLASQVQQTTTAAQAAGSAWQTALSVAGGVGLATSIGAIVGQMTAFAASVVDVATRMQSLRASLAALGGGLGAGQQQFAQLFQTAQALGVAFEPLARGWRQLTAAATQANLPLEDQRRLLTAVSNEARRVGASNDELGRIITALAQTASKGVVSMEELRQQLGEALPTALAALARGMGYTTEQITKLVETGTLRFVPFALAFTRGLEEMQSASGKFADGAQQAFNRLGNALIAFKDALGANVLPELERLAKVATGILDTATALLALAGGRRDPRLAPNMAQEIAGTPDQEREVQRLRGVITRLEQQAATAVPGPLREQREGMVQRAKEELDILLEVIQGTKNETTEQQKLTAEANRTKSAREQEAAFLQTITTQLAEARKQQAELAASSQRAPNVFGSPTGTPEQQLEFARRRQQLLEEQTKKLDATLAIRPANVELTPAIQEQLKQLGLLDQAYGKAVQRVDQLKDAEQTRARAARELEAQQERVPAQVSALQAFQERLSAFLRRPTENLAEEAASRVRVTGAAMLKELETQIQALEKSKPFQGAVPGDLEGLRAQREAVIQTTDVLAQEAYTAALTKQMSTLNDLARAYGFVTKEASDLARAEEEAARFAGTPLQAQAEERLQVVRDVATVEAQIVDLKRQAAASERAGLEAMKEARASTALDATLGEQLERLRAPREERTELRLRSQARRQGVALTPEQETQLRAITAQERFNEIMQATERIGDAAAQSLTQGLLSIIDGTERVTDAFRLMAKSILDSVAQIALNEGFKMLVRLGLSAISGAIAPTSGAAFSNAGASAGGGGGGFEILMAQGGAVINKPTAIIAGENPAMNPETILNRPQMQALMSGAMRAGPTAGGQAMGGVTIINTPNRAVAEQEAARERALGKAVIINEVLNEISQGSGSRIARTLQALR